MQDLFDRINDEIVSFQEDSNKFLVNGNKAAGVRSRKSSLALTKLFKEWREKSVEVWK